MLKNDESLKEKFVRKGFWIYLFFYYRPRRIRHEDDPFGRPHGRAGIGVFYGIISLITLVGTYNDLGLTGKRSSTTFRNSR